jgi:hypothetical protein
MLQITIPASEQFNQETNEFINSKEQVLQLEHSLISLSKWESKWCKPFLSKDVKTEEESIDYVRCMTLTQNVDPNVYNFITKENFRMINEYVEAPMTATTFSKESRPEINRDVITAEIIYYWMVTFTIPFECQKWHLNRLLTLIKVCNIKNQPQQKMSQKEIFDRNRALNAQRRQKFNTRG